MDRDRSIEHLLRRALPPDGEAAGSACPDVELLAALADDTLEAGDRRAVESHLADCQRCQEVAAAMVRTMAAEGNAAAALPWWKSRGALNWLVPAAAAAAAIALWVAVPGQRVTPAGEAPEFQMAAAPPPAPDQEPARKAQPAAEAPRELADEQPAGTRGRDEKAAAPAAAAETAAASAASPVAPAEGSLDATVALESAAASSKEEGQRAQARRESGEPEAERALGRQAAAPAASALSAADAARPAATGFEVMSPDPRVRWRIDGAVVQYSADGGATWTPQDTGSALELTAGACPSPSVCWLVGRGGTVLRTTNGGQQWQRVPIQETVDLTAVVGSTALSATVDLADGRRLGTVDGGRTWAPLRE